MDLIFPIFSSTSSEYWGGGGEHEFDEPHLACVHLWSNQLWQYGGVTLSIA